jgi:hypothetical protein
MLMAFCENSTRSCKSREEWFSANALYKFKTKEIDIVIGEEVCEYCVAQSLVCVVFGRSLFVLLTDHCIDTPLSICSFLCCFHKMPTKVDIKLHKD